MRRLKKPTDDIEEVFSACTQRMRAKTKQKYSSCFSEIKDKSIEYESKMRAGKAEEISEQKKIGTVSASEIKKLYTDRLASPKHPARHYYDLYLHNATNGICPYCNYREATTLDHFLPKAHYIPLVITPTNLVPCCKDCNKNKLDDVIHSREDVFFNPYYEDVDDTLWLKGTLIKDITQGNLSMLFSVKDDIEGVDECYIARLKNQFEKLKLGNAYGIQASRELLSVKQRLIIYYKDGGPDAALKEIHYEIKSRNDNPNSWQSAMYRGLIDPWLFYVFLPSQLNNS